MNYQNVTPIQLCQAAITTSAVTLYTVPAATRTYLKDINVCNTTGSAVNVNIYLVPAGGTASTANALVYSYSVAADSFFHWSGVQVLLPGQTLQVSASATGTTIMASGGEAT